MSGGFLVQTDEVYGPRWAFFLASGRVGWTSTPENAEQWAHDGIAHDFAFRLVERELVHSCRVVSLEDARAAYDEHTRHRTGCPATPPASGGEATKAGPLAAEREGGRPGRSRGERHALPTGAVEGDLAPNRAACDLVGAEPSPSHDSAPDAGGVTEPPASLRCLECDAEIERRGSGPPRQTCSDRCRQRRARRLRGAA